MGWAQSQSFLRRGSVAHPAVKTAIESRIAAVLNVMTDLPCLPYGRVACGLAFCLPGRLAGGAAFEPRNAKRCRKGRDERRPA